MQEIAKRLAEVQPDDETQWTISLAYATRRADSIQPAKEILLHAFSDSQRAIWIDLTMQPPVVDFGWHIVFYGNFRAGVVRGTRG